MMMRIQWRRLLRFHSALLLLFIAYHMVWNVRTVSRIMNAEHDRELQRAALERTTGEGAKALAPPSPHHQDYHHHNKNNNAAIPERPDFSSFKGGEKSAYTKDIHSAPSTTTPEQQRQLHWTLNTFMLQPQQEQKTIPRVVSTNDTNTVVKSPPLCTRPQIQSGTWVQEWLPQPPYISHTKHLRCILTNGLEVNKTNFNFNNNKNKNSNHNMNATSQHQQPLYPYWTWQPFNAAPVAASLSSSASSSSSLCEWTRWNATTFCDTMKYVTLSIIGDSLSWEQYSSLLQLLGERVHQMDQHKSKSEHRNHKQRACHAAAGGTSIVFRNDPYLKHVNESIQQDFPLVLVLNRGAHYVPNDELLHDLRHYTIPHLQTWQHICQRRLGLPCLLYWRTTVPGHVQCHEFSQPVTNREAMEARVANQSLYTPLQRTYHWQDFAEQNQLVLQLLEQSGLHFQVLDAYHLNILRPDGHRVQDQDCLHNCYPGNMDVYNTLLLHFLRMQRSAQDVEWLEQMVTTRVFAAKKKAKQQQQHQQRLNATASAEQES